MNLLARNQKFVVALLGVLASVLEQVNGQPSHWAPIVTAVSTAVAVWWVPNAAKKAPKP